MTRAGSALSFVFVGAVIASACRPGAVDWGLDAIDGMVTPADDPTLGCGLVLPPEGNAELRAQCMFRTGATSERSLGIAPDLARRIPIRHVIVAMKENRSFDHLFGDLHRAVPAIEAIPDGTYRCVDFLDNDGVDLDRPIRIEVAITIDGDRMICDLAGSSAQVRGPFNCMPSGSLCAACFAVRVIGGDEIPTNGGCFRPIELRLPEASIVNPSPPAPVGCRTATIKRLANAMLSCLREALPERIGADSGAQLLTVLMGGHLPGRGEYAVSVPLASGSGAASACDGVGAIETDATNTLNLPIEALEFDAPLRVHRLGLAPDSGGPGRHRGGQGCVQEFEVLDGTLTVTFRGERQVNPAPGVNGGLAGGKSYGVIRRSDGREETIPSKTVTRLAKGDRLVAVSAGGGGHGDPRERERSLVAQDLREGRISARAAREIYGLSGDVSG